MVRKQFLLRIDPELWQELEKWAAEDLRSVNAPCVTRKARIAACWRRWCR